MMDVEAVKLSRYWESSICLAVLLGATFAFVVIYFWFTKKSSPNPFMEDYLRDPEPVETNPKKRDQVIKQGFKIDKVPKDLDAIVIGSGLGGLSCAACLARSGKKVLILEQHDRAGGCTHTYEEKGFEFDIGIHYIGEGDFGSAGHTLFDILSDGQLVWEMLDKEFDTVVIKQPDNVQKHYSLVYGEGDFEKRLIQHFPREEKAIMEFIAMVKKCSNAFFGYAMLKMMPKTLLKIMIKLKLYKLCSFGFEECSRKTVAEVLDSLTDNDELKAVLGYCFGEYGTVPSKAPFFIHALILYHFYHGSYYPRGGASEIAYTMIPAILRNGGAVLVRAPVKRIIMKNGKAVGVTVTKNETEHEIFAPAIISNAGAYNTYGRLLPKDVGNALGLETLEKNIGHGFSCLQVLIGLNGTAEELQLKKRNYWVFESNKPEKLLLEYAGLPREDAANMNVPMLFVTFPSAKDSTWQERHPDKSVGIIMTFASWEWFKEWDDERVMKRGRVYEDLKRTFQDRIYSQFIHLFPQLDGKVEYIDTGTPITHSHYISSPRGEIYGVNHSMKRFSYEIAMDMRPKTIISGLFLTGQDVLTGGIEPAAFGGVLTASEVLGRNLMKDLFQISGNRRRSQKNKTE